MIRCRGGRRRGLAAVGVALSLAVVPPATSGTARAQAARAVDATRHTSGTVRANGTTLHWLDFGGDGPALVFLAGLGNTAHVFDEFAPRFTDRWHVLALTRRGYGESGRPETGFDTGTLADDVRGVLDSLGIARAVLTGHSVAGDELTEFAARYPERVAGLIYLDAAYDRSHTATRLLTLALLGQVPPAPPGPKECDRRDPAAASDYVAGLYGVRWPAGEILATRDFDTNGRWHAGGVPAGTNRRVMQGERTPRYAEITAPVLALYSVGRGVHEDFPWIERLMIGRGAAHDKAARFMAAQGRYEAGERRRLARELPAARLVELRRVPHYLFLAEPAAVEREMRSFLREIAS